MFVLTRAINEYYQEGHYLVSVFESKPTKQQLEIIFSDGNIGSVADAKLKEIVDHVLAGGGRRDVENEWFYLTELAPGAIYNATAWG